MDSRKEIVHNITAQILCAESNNLGTVVKHSDKLRRNELNNADYSHARANDKYNGISQGELCSVRLACADILCAECGN